MAKLANIPAHEYVHPAKLCFVLVHHRSSVAVRRLFATTEQASAVADDVHTEPEPLTKSVEVQTMYRESESQTDPYTPAYVVPKGENPEVLVLSNLGHGKPATHQGRLLPLVRCPLTL